MPSMHVVISRNSSVHSYACRLRCAPSVRELPAASLPGVEVTAIALHERDGVREGDQAPEPAFYWQLLHVQYLHDHSSW